MTMQPGLSPFSAGGQGIGGFFQQQSQPYGQPINQLLQTLQYVPHQLQQLQQVQWLHHQHMQQLLQIIPAQLQQLQQAVQLIAQQIPGLQGQQQFGQTPWASMPQAVGSGFGTPFQPQAFGSQFGQPGQVM